MSEPKQNPPKPTVYEALRYWLTLGFTSFGGPTAQIAMMHTELVVKRKWIPEGKFLQALNFAMVLPGPEAQQLAIYIGWSMHGPWGGILAGGLFVLPAAIILWGLSLIYVYYSNIIFVTGLFYGLKATIIAILLLALQRIASKVLKNRTMWVVTMLSFCGIYFFHFPFPLIILVAALIGYLGHVFGFHSFSVLQGHAAILESEEGKRSNPFFSKADWRRSLKIIFWSLLLWWSPLLVVGIGLGINHTIFQQGLFFSKAATVTFGGAYAVLPYVSQQAVEHFKWLTAGQMLDGLGLAETTPGPLIMVLQFVGFLGAWNHPGNLPPLVAATLGSFISTWTTFVPCFLWIFLGAPYVERIKSGGKINASLSVITAAVVGLMMSLALWFSIHVIYHDQRVDFYLMTLSILTWIALKYFKWGMIPVIGASALIGVVMTLAKNYFSG